MATMKNDTKKIFWKKGTCSQTFFYLLDREFGNIKESEERASDPLCGGLMQGHQCGMLWGASLAVGAESFRRHNDQGQSISVTIMATQNIMDSFIKRTKSANCREITGCDLTTRLGRTKLMLKAIAGGLLNSSCFNLAEKWTPEAIQSAKEGLSHEQTQLTLQPLSCASEVVKRMGASDEEMVMVAGFAGGLGLSGNACGALSAAMWMNSLYWCRKNPGKNAISNPATKSILKSFCVATDSNFMCHKITGQRFKTIDDHTEFIRNGGCDKLINVLADHNSFQ